MWKYGDFLPSLLSSLSPTAPQATSHDLSDSSLNHYKYWFPGVSTSSSSLVTPPSQSSPSSTTSFFQSSPAIPPHKNCEKIWRPYEEPTEEDWLKDATWTINDQARKNTPLSYATLPQGLIFYPSSPNYNTMGVWTTKPIMKGSRFGPLKGRIISEGEMLSLKRGVCYRSDLWPIFSSPQSITISHYLDTSNLIASNWMRFVSFSSLSSSQNLLACQFQDFVYFFATEDIPQGAELRVWFHPQYMHRILHSSYIHYLLKDEKTSSHNFPLKQNIKEEKEDPPTTTPPSELPPISTDSKKCTEPQLKGKGHSSLGYELRRVDGKLIYECNFCKKICGQLSNLKTHLFIHTGERPFACPHCNKTFTQKAHLDKHKLTHLRSKHYK
ncbi:hypothetical protein HELRODRAFT_105412 [Helobdella robusta]|uniref:Uncharacterized protein n=1 Tax=Helobdella robusta TaxID=6412 RepID=T1EDU6_HELRO|nr:hypothetical protein HELRODRAFT_105412 [Helobdella robusta]ESO12583.1 hypothetical protein HELRODRAFT_105412 [Helobdella robusta]